MIQISIKAIGRKKPILGDFSVPAPQALAAGKPVTLRELLDHVVRGEVDSFKHRQESRRMLHVLTAKQIEESLLAGKVQSGGSDLDQKVDVEEAIVTAIEAFSDGLYMVLVDDNEIRELDAVLPMTPDSRLTFIRLTMLAGG